MGMTMVEKILAKATGQSAVKANDVLEPMVDLAMSHENGALVINQFSEIYKDTGLEAKVWDPAKIAIIFDHRVPAESSKTAGNQKKIRDFVAKQGITKFHDIRGDGGGICHQILPEYGYVRPGSVVVGKDAAIGAERQRRQAVAEQAAVDFGQRQQADQRAVLLGEEEVGAMAEGGFDHPLPAGAVEEGGFGVGQDVGVPVGEVGGLQQSNPDLGRRGGRGGGEFGLHVH